MRYFTSDTHFSANIFSKKLPDFRDYRPFKTTKEMNRKIIKYWNSILKKEDTLYHLGDFCNYNDSDHLSWSHALGLVRKINAKVILILGNNEERVMKNHFNGDFEKFKQYLLGKGFYDVINSTGIYLEMRGQKFFLNHFPTKHKKEVINLFGHIHHIACYEEYGFNVGVDLFHFKPLNENEIFEILTDKSKFFVDPQNQGIK